MSSIHIKRTLLTLLSVGAVSTASSHAALIAYWNFNDLSIATASAPGAGGVPLSITASQGTGTLSLETWSGLVDDFGGSSINALGTDPAEESLSLVSTTGNNAHVTFSVSTLGLSDVVITFATRGTSTGYDSGLWSYSVNGGAFVNSDLPNTATRSTSFALATADFSAIAAVDNQANVIFRYTLSGATSTSGNNRIDNIQFNAIPEPTSAIAGILLSLGLLRRRRA